MVFVVLLVAFALLLRLYVLGRQPINSDEAVVGLMARGILHGHFSAFYWGQSYGGVEPYAVALVFAVLGQSGLTLGLTATLLDALSAVLVWRVGRRLFGPRTGAVGAVLFLVWPEVSIWQSTLEYGFRWAAMCCGLGCVLLALRRLDRPGDPPLRRTLEWAGLGLVAGLGWWASPEIAYFLVPLAGVVCWRLARVPSLLSARQFLAGALGAGVGALPWIWANLAERAGSFVHAPQPDPRIASRVNIERLHVAPILLGLQQRVSGRWLFGPTAGRLLCYGLVLVGLWIAVVLVRRRQGVLVVCFLFFFPVLYALSPFTWYWADGRYAVYATPFICLLFAAGASIGAGALARRLFAPRPAAVAGRWAAPAVLLVPAVLLTLLACDRLAPYRPDHVAGTGRASWTSWRSDPIGLGALAAGLERAGVHDAYAGYWLAYALDFSSRGELAASDVRPRYVRSAAILGEVESAKAPVWLFVAPDRARYAKTVVGVSVLDPGCAVLTDTCVEPGTFEAYLGRQRDGYRVVRVGFLLGVVPDRRVRPDAVLSALHVTS